MRKSENGRIKIGVIILVLLLIIIAIVIGAFCWYKTGIKPVQSESETVIVEIIDGSGVSKIASQLEEQGLINNAKAFKIYYKINNKKAILAGKYELDKKMTVEEIITQLEKGNVVDETVTITFPEGKNMRWITETIAKNTSNSEEEIYELIADEEYQDLLIEKYWFIDEDIKDKDIYYPLEGYLYPDTYIFENKDVDTKVIFEKMLDKMDSVLTPYKNEIKKSDYSMHEILSLASVVELEAKNEEDRAGVAAVFINRLNKNMALQSDVTTYYALKIDMSERDLTASELAKKNPYNTRSATMNGKIPVGPICMPSGSSIEAVIEHEDTENLFFVADKNGKVYFSKTNSEHEKKIKELKNSGLWFTY